MSRATMKANAFPGRNATRIEEVERPTAGVGEAIIRVTLTTICGTDMHRPHRLARLQTAPRIL